MTRRTLSSILVLCVSVSSGAAGFILWRGIVASRPSTAISRLSRRLDESVGATIPQLRLETLGGGLQEVSQTVGSGFAVLLFFATDDCLYCLADLAEWSAFAKSGTAVKVIGIGVDADLGKLSALVESESLAFPVLVDGRGAFQEALGLPKATPLRLLVLRSTVVLISAGPDRGRLSFRETVQLLIAGADGG